MKASDEDVTSICVIGPVHPFRSGIATHTTALAEEFSSTDKIELSVISFSTLYPAWLFPGDSSVGAVSDTATRVTVDYSLSAINPLSWIRTIRKVRQMSPDIVIIPLWSFFPAPCLGWVAAGCRRHGLKVTTIVHNVVDHEPSPIKRRLLNYQARSSDHFLCHSHGAAEELSRKFSDQGFSVHPLPIGRGFPIQIQDSLVGIDLGRKTAAPKKTLLFFGIVRPYKGLDIALEALAQIKDDSVNLVIAGEIWSGAEEVNALIDRLQIRRRVTLIPRYVAAEEVSALFYSCDLVVLPYRAISSSAVLPLAYTFGKPVVTSNLPGLTEQVEQGLTGWITPDNTPASLAKTIETCLRYANSEQVKRSIKRKAREMTWNSYAHAATYLDRDRPTYK